MTVRVDINSLETVINVVWPDAAVTVAAAAAAATDPASYAATSPARLAAPHVRRARVLEEGTALRRARALRGRVARRRAMGRPGDRVTTLGFYVYVRI